MVRINAKSKTWRLIQRIIFHLTNIDKQDSPVNKNFEGFVLNAL